MAQTSRVWNMFASNNKDHKPEAKKTELGLFVEVLRCFGLSKCITVKLRQLDWFCYFEDVLPRIRVGMVLVIKSTRLFFFVFLWISKLFQAIAPETALPTGWGSHSQANK